MARLCYIVLLAIQGYVAMGFLQNCAMPRKCRDVQVKRELDSIKWMPTTEEQLNRLCPAAVEMFQCAAESIEDCTGKPISEVALSDEKTESDFGHVIMTIRNLIIDLCTPGNPTRENYLASMSCVKPYVLNPEPTMNCIRQGQAVYETYQRSRAQLGDDIFGDDKRSEPRCMVSAYALACFASLLQDECGDVSRIALVDILKRFKSLRYNDCSETNILNLKTKFLEYLELDEEKREVYSSVFSSKKRRK